MRFSLTKSVILFSADPGTMEASKEPKLLGYDLLMLR